MRIGRVCVLAAVVFTACLAASDQGKRKIIIDQDAAGPGGTDQQAILMLIQSPQTEVLGITVVTGDAWLKSEVAHTLRTLELIGRTDIPVVPGAENPLVRTKEATELWQQRFGALTWLGAWTPRFYHPSDKLVDMPDVKPTTNASDVNTAHFMRLMVRRDALELMIYACGPMTKLAVASSLHPEYAGLAKELVVMG